MPSPLQVVPAEASKATISLLSGQTLKAGDSVYFNGQLTDQYGNFIANKQISFGSLGTTTTDANGYYYFSFTIPANLTEISLQVDGNPISVVDINGKTMAALPVKIAQQVSFIENFEAGSNVFNFTGDWYRDYSPNSSYALTSGSSSYASSQFTVNVPDNAINATLSFKYMNNNNDSNYYVYIDGQLVVSQYGGYYWWSSFYRDLTPGSHTVQIVYSPYNNNSGSAYIDNINLTYWQ